MKILSAKKTLRTGKISQFIFKLPILLDRNYTKQNKKSVSWYTSSIWLRCYYFFWLNVLQMCYLALPDLLFFMFSTYFVSVCHVSPTRWSSSEHFTLCSKLGSMSCFWFSVSRTMPGTEPCLQNEELNKQNSVFSLFSTHKSKVEKSLSLFGSFRNQNQTPKSLFSESMVVILSSWGRVGVGKRVSFPVADYHHSSNNPVECWIRQLTFPREGRPICLLVLIPHLLYDWSLAFTSMSFYFWNSFPPMFLNKNKRRREKNSRRMSIWLRTISFTVASRDQSILKSEKMLKDIRKKPQPTASLATN